MSVTVHTSYLSTSLVAAEAALKHIVDEFYPLGSAFKVGMSVRPVKRILGVGPNSMQDYFAEPREYGLKNPTYRYELSAIYFLYETDDYPCCQRAESTLIVKLDTFAKSRCLNEAGGGGGRPPASGPPYYVYLVRSP